MTMVSPKFSSSSSGQGQRKGPNQLAQELMSDIRDLCQSGEGKEEDIRELAEFITTGKGARILRELSALDEPQEQVSRFIIRLLGFEERN